MTLPTILDKLAIVNLNIHIWTARKKLTAHDLGHTDLPPEDLASLGSKRICNPEDLRVFGKLKARATTLLERHGIRFLSGWAIPLTHTTTIMEELAHIRDEFIQAKESFLQQYEQSIQEWIHAHPEWSSIIANSIVSEEYVRSRLDFRWQLFQIQQPEIGVSQEDTLLEDINALGDTLFDEIAKTATDTWHRCYAGKTEVTRKALSPLKGILAKLQGLTFVEPRVTPVVELLETAFLSIPRRGVIMGNTLIMLQGLVMLLQNPRILLEHGQIILEGRKDTHTVLQSLLEPEGDTSRGSDELIEPKEISDTGVAIAVAPTIESHGLW